MIKSFFVFQLKLSSTIVDDAMLFTGFVVLLN